MTTHPDVRDDEQLYVYSEEDVAGIVSDMYVDVREVTNDDKTAAAIVEIFYERLTDDYYAG